MRRTLLATALILGFATAAQATTCQTLALDNTTDGWTATIVENAEPVIQSGVVGYFLNYGADVIENPEDMASAEIPDGATGATVCPDGVTFSFPVVEEPAEVPTVEVELPVVVVTEVPIVVYTAGLN